MLEIEHADENDKVPSGMTEIKPEDAIATPIDVDDTEFDDIEDFKSSEDHECLIGGITNKLTNKLIFWVCIIIILMALLAIALDAQIERRFNKMYDQIDQIVEQEKEAEKEYPAVRTIAGSIVNATQIDKEGVMKYVIVIEDIEVEVPEYLYSQLYKAIGNKVKLVIYSEKHDDNTIVKTFDWEYMLN